MPRLSLYNPKKNNDYRFIDRQISEMFQVGGTDVYLHKYMGPKSPTDENATVDQPQFKDGDGNELFDVTNIQDLLFLENRDRKYDSEVYCIRGLYNVQNIDFNLSQFGLFLDNDTLYMTVHINDFIKFIGRKPISGDVIELPHLRDDFSLGAYDVSLPRYYVIEDVGRASEGFSVTWYPHLYRLKLKKILANQQYADILNKPVGEDADRFVGDFVPGTVYYKGQIVRMDGVMYQVTADPSTELAPPDATAWAAYAGNTLESLLSTRAKELEINDAIIGQAEEDAALSGFETRQFYTLGVDPTTGKPLIQTADMGTLDTSNASYLASENAGRPQRAGYTGYLLGDGYPMNGYQTANGTMNEFGHGVQFPASPGKDDFFLRTDYMPNRLFRFSGTSWDKVEDAVRMTMTNTDTRNTQKTSFINNTNTNVFGDEVVPERQSLSKALKYKPEADL